MTMRSARDIQPAGASEHQRLSDLEGPKFSFALVIKEAKKGQGA